MGQKEKEVKVTGLQNLDQGVEELIKAKGREDEGDEEGCLSEIPQETHKEVSEYTNSVEGEEEDANETSNASMKTQSDSAPVQEVTPKEKKSALISGILNAFARESKRQMNKISAKEDFLALAKEYDVSEEYLKSQFGIAHFKEAIDKIEAQIQDLDKKIKALEKEEYAKGSVRAFLAKRTELVEEFENYADLRKYAEGDLYVMEEVIPERLGLYKSVKGVIATLIDPKFAKTDLDPFKRKTSLDEVFKELFNLFVIDDVYWHKEKGIRWGGRNLVPTYTTKEDEVLTRLYKEVTDYYASYIQERRERVNGYFLVKNTEGAIVRFTDKDTDEDIIAENPVKDFGKIAEAIEGHLYDIEAWVPISDDYLKDGKVVEENVKHGSMLIAFPKPENKGNIDIFIWGVQKPDDDYRIESAIRAAEKVFMRRKSVMWRGREETETIFAECPRKFSFRSGNPSQIKDRVVRKSLEYVLNEVKKEKEERKVKEEEAVKKTAEQEEREKRNRIHDVNAVFSDKESLPSETVSYLVFGSSRKGKEIGYILQYNAERKTLTGVKALSEFAREIAEAVMDMEKGREYDIYDLPFRARDFHLLAWAKKAGRPLEEGPVYFQRPAKKTEEKQEPIEVQDAPVSEEIKDPVDISASEEVRKIVEKDNASVQSVQEGTPLSQFSDFFSKREIGILGRAGITTPEQFKEKFEELSSRKGIGPKTLEKFNEFLKKQ